MNRTPLTSTLNTPREEGGGSTPPPAPPLSPGTPAVAKGTPNWTFYEKEFVERSSKAKPDDPLVYRDTLMVQNVPRQLRTVRSSLPPSIAPTTATAATTAAPLKDKQPSTATLVPPPPSHAAPPVPPSGSSACLVPVVVRDDLDPLVRAATEAYGMPWKQITTTTPLPPPPTPQLPSESPLPSLIYERDLPPTADAQLTGLTAAGAPGSFELDTEVLGKGAAVEPTLKHRPSLFRVCPVPPLSTIQTPNSFAKPCFTPPGISIAVEFKSLHLEAGNSTEPFYGSLFLYDLETREKVTETFHFDCQSGAGAAAQHPLTVFRVEQRKPTVFMVVVLYHVLRGDYDEAVEMYMKGASALGPKNTKDYNKWLAELTEATGRMKEYRQYFCWCATALFNETGDMLSTIRGDLKFENMTKIKDDLPTFLTKLSNAAMSASPLSSPAASTSSQATIPGTLLVNINDLATITCNSTKPLPFTTLDPQQIPLTPTHPNQPPTSVVAQELMTFRQNGDVVVPHLDYVNCLYLYPESLNFTNYKGVECSARNIYITFKLLDTDISPGSSGLLSFYDTTDVTNSGSGSKLSFEGHLAVQYHQKKPKFTGLDEIKVQLPHTITPAHHFIVTYYHIDCKKKGQATCLPLGYSVIPLMSQQQPPEDSPSMTPGPWDLLKDSTRLSVKVALSLPPGYMKGIRSDSDFFKWIDNGRELVSFRCKWVSSVYPTSPGLYRTLTLRAETAADSKETIESLKQSVGAVEKVQFMNLLIPKLLRVITWSGDLPSLAGVAFEQLLWTLKDISDETQQSKSMIVEPVLESFIEYFFSGVDEGVAIPLHEALVNQWMLLLKRTDRDRTDLKRLMEEFSWFLFGLIFKSMTLSLHSRHLLPLITSRSALFSSAFIQSVQILVSMMGAQVSLGHGNVSVARDLNASTVLFLRNLLDVMDRGLCFEMIHKYLALLDSTTTLYLDMNEHKFTALQILFQHPQSLQLNLPSNETLTATSEVTIEQSFTQRHFLAGMLLREVKTAMLSPESTLRQMGISTLYDVLFHLDRTNDPTHQQMMTTIISCFFPYLINAADGLCTVFNEDNTSTTSNYSSSVEYTMWLIVALHIIKWCPKMVHSWLHNTSESRVVGFLEILARVPEAVKYSGRDSCLAFDLMGSGGVGMVGHCLSPSIDAKNGNNNKQTNTTTLTRSAHKAALDTKLFIEEQISSKMNRRNQSSSSSSAIKQIQQNKRWTMAQGSAAAATAAMNQDVVMMIKNLYTEASTIVLESVTQLSTQFKSIEATLSSDIMMRFFNVYTALFRTDQSMEFLCVLFYYLQLIMLKFKRQIFREQSPVCQTLTLQTLSLCNSSLLCLRSKSGSMLYNMVTYNHMEMRNFSRMKLQTTIAMSKLVIEQTDFNRMRQVWETVCSSFQRTPLEREMLELKERLFMIIRDSMTMKVYEHDPEMTAELYHNLSKGFLDSPDLRLTWLDNLCKLQLRHGHLEEAAEVKAVMASLIALYLNIVRKFPVVLPVTDWVWVVPNFAKEINAMPSREMLLSVKEEICNGPEFKISGFEKLIKEAVECMQQANNMELCCEGYQILIPLLRQLRQFNKLSAIYSEMARLCSSIAAESKTNSRVAPHYYRVGFYGSAFGPEVNGKQYIYKETAFVRLSDLQTRLQDQYKGKMVWELLPNTKDVVVKDLDPAKSYIQLGSVMPVVAHSSSTSEEMLEPTMMQKQFNINQFVMEVPFTKNKAGQNQGDIADQWKRRVVMTVGRSFPDLLKRQMIIKQTEELVPPIRNAIEMLQSKVDSLQMELTAKTPNSKTLQMTLGGILLARVNVGPTEIGNVFLNEKNRSLLVPKPTAEEIKCLTEVAITFVTKLGFALKLHNSLLTGDEHSEIKELLEKEYNTFKSSITAFVSPPASPAPPPPLSTPSPSH